MIDIISEETGIDRQALHQSSRVKIIAFVLDLSFAHILAILWLDFFNDCSNLNQFICLELFLCALSLWFTLRDKTHYLAVYLLSVLFKIKQPTEKELEKYIGKEKKRIITGIDIRNAQISALLEQKNGLIAELDLLDKDFETFKSNTLSDLRSV